MRKIISGIYIITSIDNDKKYIGSSKDVLDRLSRHKTDLRGNRHCNEYMQRAWNKYGEDGFLFALFKECNDYIQEDLFKEEEKWINKFNTLDERFGYNLILPGLVPGSIKGRVKKPRKGQRVVSLNIETREIETFESIKLLSESKGIQTNKIRRVISYWNSMGEAKGCKKSYKGFIYVYEKDYDSNFDYINFKKERSSDSYHRLSEEEKQQRLEQKANKPKRSPREWSVNMKPVILEHKETGETIELDCIADCINKYNMCRTIVAKVLKRNFKERSHKGFYIRYK